MISAEVICDSITPSGSRLTTMKLRYPKFIHGEFMTHRVFSRNASSSRAIPTAKLLEEVRTDALRAGPVFWGKNQKGMQAAEELTSEPKGAAQALWNDAASIMADYAVQLAQLGVHKQIVNRLLEPFSHINVLVTATEWGNFFGLRLDAGAQPEMRALAEAIWAAREASTPEVLSPGEWHLPFVEREDWAVLWPDAPDGMNPNGPWLDAAIRVSVARCARVSYESFETGRRSTVKEDLKLYDRLLGSTPIHASPAEHQATPDVKKGFWDVVDGNNGSSEGRQGWQYEAQWGNFVGWRQYRKMLSGEAIAPLPEQYR